VPGKAGKRPEKQSSENKIAKKILPEFPFC